MLETGKELMSRVKDISSELLTSRWNGCSRTIRVFYIMTKGAGQTSEARGPERDGKMETSNHLPRECTDSQNPQGLGQLIFKNERDSLELWELDRE